MGSGIIAYIDFANYTAGQTNLDGQGVAPFTWTQTDGANTNLQLANSFRIINNGDPSGNVARRSTSDTTALEKVSQIMLNSGISPTTYDKVVYDVDIAVQPPDGRTDFYWSIRSDEGAWNEQEAIEFNYIQSHPTNGNFLFLRAQDGAGGSAVIASAYFIEDDSLTDLTMRIVDDLENGIIEGWLLASGVWQLIATLTTDLYNDVTSNPKMVAINHGGSQHMIIDNVVITAFGSGFPDPTPASSVVGTVGPGRFVSGPNQSRFVRVY
jgi:hypothetical protein